MRACYNQRRFARNVGTRVVANGAVHPK